MDPSVVIWIGLLIALAQTVVIRILNYYFPDGYHRSGLVKDAPKKDNEITDKPSENEDEDA